MDDKSVIHAIALILIGAMLTLLGFLAAVQVAENSGPRFATQPAPPSTPKPEPRGVGQIRVYDDTGDHQYQSTEGINGANVSIPLLPSKHCTTTPNGQCKIDGLAANSPGSSYSLNVVVSGQPTKVATLIIVENPPGTYASTPEWVDFEY